MYEVGTIKLTWIDTSNYSILKSKMFRKDKLQEAIADGEKLGRFMLFSLERTNNHNYTWKLLPYGQSNDFVRSMKLRDSLLAKVAIVGLAIFSVYGIVTYLSKNKLGINV
jgi:hypothetical protein